MPVDKVELAKDLETPEYQTIVKETLSKKDFTVRTKDEETAFQENYKKDVIEKEIPKKISEVYSTLDKDIEEVSGIKRDQNEKTYDYNKRVLKSLKEGASPDLKKYTDKISELEKQIADGDKSGATKKLLQEAEDKYKASLQEKDNLIQKLQGETTATKKEALLTNAYAGVKSSFKKELPAMFDRTEKAILSEILQSSVVGDDGKLYVGDGKGGIAKDKAFNPITVDVKLKEEFAAVISTTPAPRGGAGSSGGDENKDTPVDQMTADNFIVPDTIKTGGDLIEYMMEQGLKRGTDQFNKIYEAKRLSLGDAKGLKAQPAPDKK